MTRDETLAYAAKQLRRALEDLKRGRDSSYTPHGQNQNVCIALACVQSAAKLLEDTLE